MAAGMLPEQFETLLTNLAAVFPVAGLLIASDSPLPAHVLMVGGSLDIGA